MNGFGNEVGGQVRQNFGKVDGINVGVDDLALRADDAGRSNVRAEDSGGKGSADSGKVAAVGVGGDVADSDVFIVEEGVDVAVSERNFGAELGFAGRFGLDIVEVPGIIAAFLKVEVSAVDSDSVDTTGAVVVEGEEFEGNAGFVDLSDNGGIFIEDLNVAQNKFIGFEGRQAELVDMSGADFNGRADDFAGFLFSVEQSFLKEGVALGMNVKTGGDERGDNDSAGDLYELRHGG